jgi:serine/threonine protein phosphatase PrpC
MPALPGVIRMDGCAAKLYAIPLVSGARRLANEEMAEEQIKWDDYLRHAAISDVGMRRANNQDSYTFALASDREMWQARGHLFIVADGMGAHAAGELASKLATDGIPHRYLKYRELSPPEALQRAVVETNTEINRRGQANPDFHNMGTTCSVLVLLPQGAVVSHIGDSRIYRLRGQNLEQLTFDHSLVWEMRAAGQIPADGSAHSIPKNVITRSLGPHPAVQVDVEGPFPLEVGDTFLLCSDGLSGKVEDDELGPLLACLSPNEAVQVMVDLANLRGGPDNITVIVAQVTGAQLSTQVASSEPIRIGGERQKRAVHPALWGAMGACFLAALGMLFLHSFIPALLAAIGGLATLGAVLYQKYGGIRPGVALTGERRLGRGPYTKTPSAPNAEFVQKLADVVKQIQDAGDEEHWTVEWGEFEGHCERATMATQSGNYPLAVREYARAISFMMQELRTHGRKKASDSSIDLV